MTQDDDYRRGNKPHWAREPDPIAPWSILIWYCIALFAVGFIFIVCSTGGLRT